MEDIAHIFPSLLAVGFYVFLEHSTAVMFKLMLAVIVVRIKLPQPKCEFLFFISLFSLCNQI